MNRIKPLQLKKLGSVMALVLVAIVMFLVVGAGLLSLGMHGRMQAVRTASDIVARCAADAGLTKALFEMNKNLEISGYNWNESALPYAAYKVLPNCDATFSYTVTVDSNGTYAVESIGDFSQAQRRVNSTLRLQSVFDYGIFVQGTMVLKNGTTIDGYNFEAGDNLKIGTNSTTEGAITAKLGVTIDGDVVVGMGAVDPIDVVDSTNEAVITGDVYNLPEENPLPSVTVPQYLQQLPSQGTLANAGTISSSTRYDSINLGNADVVTIDGAVVLYVAGDVILNNSAQLQIVDADTNPNASLTLYLGGNIVCQNGGTFNNIAGVPGKLKIFALDTCQNIDFKNSGVFYGAIYAPASDVHLYNSVEVFGSIIANSFLQDVNANFHYDASLRDGAVNDEGVRFVVERWSEQ